MKETYMPDMIPCDHHGPKVINREGELRCEECGDALNYKQQWVAAAVQPLFDEIKRLEDIILERKLE